ncbi:hypothetical protein E2C01_046477 [Portunus trituberculatus]|uniref:Uncharacterized protein n=1 Tax=Portunus trituberculatus TaxID=210409 RepID=A0A5B7G596_PORTR|nr:hypothetical protein [Portunus trituberculatus]
MSLTTCCVSARTLPAASNSEPAVSVPGHCLLPCPHFPHSVWGWTSNDCFPQLAILCHIPLKTLSDYLQPSRDIASDVTEQGHTPQAVHFRVRASRVIFPLANVLTSGSSAQDKCHHFDTDGAIHVSEHSNCTHCQADPLFYHDLNSVSRTFQWNDCSHMAT